MCPQSSPLVRSEKTHSGCSLARSLPAQTAPGENHTRNFSPPVRGVADGPKSRGETVAAARPDRSGSRSVRCRAESRPGPVGVEPEDLEAQSLDRLQVGKHVGFRALSCSQNDDAQVGDRRRRPVGRRRGASRGRTSSAKLIVAHHGSSPNQSSCMILGLRIVSPGRSFSRIVCIPA